MPIAQRQQISKVQEWTSKITNKLTLQKECKLSKIEAEDLIKLLKNISASLKRLQDDTVNMKNKLDQDNLLQQDRAIANINMYEKQIEDDRNSYQSSLRSQKCTCTQQQQLICPSFYCHRQIISIRYNYLFNEKILRTKQQSKRHFIELIQQCSVKLIQTRCIFTFSSEEQNNLYDSLPKLKQGENYCLLIETNEGTCIAATYYKFKEVEGAFIHSIQSHHDLSLKEGKKACLRIDQPYLFFGENDLRIKQFDNKLYYTSSPLSSFDNVNAEFFIKTSKERIKNYEIYELEFDQPCPNGNIY